jgi:WD40 repeat protein
MYSHPRDPIMTISPKPVLCALIGIVVVSAQAARAADGPDKAFPGAKLLHKFPNECYRIPVLLDSEKGPRLLVWIDEFDPLTPPRFPGEPLKDAVFDVIVWDVKASKELQKLNYPKEGAPYSPVSPDMSNSAMFGPFGMLAFSPDGKQLAALSTTYKMVPGKVVHEATTQIKLIDMESKKSQPANSTGYKGPTHGPHVLFAPDGALVILKDTSCSIQEPGKDKPRKTFDLVREAGWAKFTESYAIYEAALSPDGSQMAVGADGMITVYDLKEGKKLFEAKRAAPDAKGNSNHNNARVSLVFAPSEKEQTLLAAEIVTGPPKSFVLARLFDLKEKKETQRWTLAEEKTKAAAFGVLPPNWGRAYGYFTAKNEPRILFDGKLIDGANGKSLSELDPGAGLILSRDGKYLVRVTRKKDDKKMGVELWSLESEK